jgi:hypothetical protein
MHPTLLSPRICLAQKKKNTLFCFMSNPFPLRLGCFILLRFAGLIGLLLFLYTIYSEDAKNTNTRTFTNIPQRVYFSPCVKEKYFRKTKIDFAFSLLLQLPRYIPTRSRPLVQSTPFFDTDDKLKKRKRKKAFATSK